MPLLRRGAALAAARPAGAGPGALALKGRGGPAARRRALPGRARLAAPGQPPRRRPGGRRSRRYEFESLAALSHEVTYRDHWQSKWYNSDFDCQLGPGPGPERSVHGITP
jgi:hypothetical protein